MFAFLMWFPRAYSIFFTLIFALYYPGMVLIRKRSFVRRRLNALQDGSMLYRIKKGLLILSQEGVAIGN